MIDDIIALNKYFIKHESSEYSRSNYDKFLRTFHPEKFNFSSIHLSGTNGKGSTALFLSHCLFKAHYHVGLYHSPFYQNVLEMILIDDRKVDEKLYLDIFNQYQNNFEEYHLTSFEMQTFIAYRIFEELKLDIVIIEVGMGGIVDATNIITPILSIITSVSLEHTAYLGHSLSEIAYNKAGIIKDYVPVLVGKLSEEALIPIYQKIKECHSILSLVDDFHHVRYFEDGILFDYLPYHDIKIATRAFYQIKNASIAIEALKIIAKDFFVSEEQMRQGLMMPLLKGRYEYIDEHTLIDGAHNKEAIENLVASLSRDNKKPIHTLFASFLDKNIDAILPLLSSVSSSITITTFPHRRARKEEDYFLYLGDYAFKEDCYQAYLELREKYPDDLILITGSLYFAYLMEDYLS